MNRLVATTVLAAALALTPWTGMAASKAGELASGRLEAAGGYLTPAPAATVSIFPDGSILLVGHGPMVDERLAQRDLTAALRARRDAPRIAAPDPDPKLWSSATRGWRRLPPTPDCPAGPRYFHTATVLADGRVLLAGGLCDFPKMADDPAPWPPHTRTAVWDGARRQWGEGPSLAQARIHHTATLMPDGSVIIGGGQGDPALADQGTPALGSVERFTGDAMKPAPPLGQARARHSAIALADGTLLIAGGFGSEGRALASVESLTPGAASWTALPPLRTARHSHTATLLADGRILVAGGKDVDENALASTEIWDPARKEWLAGPELPVALNAHAAARLTNGHVMVAGGVWIASPLTAIPWAWTWGPATAEWKVAGSAMPRDATDLAGGVAIAPRADNSALIFTARTILRWRPGAGPENPRWDTRPSIAPLKGARALVVGYEHGGLTNSAIARLWDAATNRWSAAGTPLGGERMEGATAELPSGRVIHVAVNMDNTFVCRMWDPPERWEDCGAVKLEYMHRGRPQVGTLPNGRAFVIVGEHEAVVLDEGSRQWTPARLQWDRTNFAYGAPVRRDLPFASLMDRASGKPIAIEDAGARYYNANLSGGTVAMLWDASASRWAYVFADRRVGVDAQWLPDGCAISTSPLALFDPRQAEARRLPDPGLGLDGQRGAMAVLDDGTVAIAGATAAGEGGFFARKASCAGFAAVADPAPYIAPELEAQTAAASTVSRAPGPSQPTGLGPWMARVVENRWLLLAILGPIALFLLLRRTRIGTARAPASRGFRIAIYAIVAIVLAPFVLQFVAFHLSTTAGQCVESPLRCKDDPPWWLALARKAKPEAAPPCKLVGVWSSQRRGQVNPIELKDDGTYEMKVGNQRYTGLWRFEVDRLVWQHEQAPGAQEVNPIEWQGDLRFNLTEQNGQLTRFELIRKVASVKCTQ